MFQSVRQFGRWGTGAVLASALSVILLAIDHPWMGEAQAQMKPEGGSSGTGANIRATRHNFSGAAPTRATTTQATTTEGIVQRAGGQTDEVCVYCHTPHGASTTAGAPLWNRTMSTANYTAYTSSTLNAALTDTDVTSANLGTPSKLCLACHDGTIAVGQVSNSPGSGLGAGVTLTIPGTAPTPAGSMPFGRGQANANHGFTRRLGTDLRNDHPIAFTFNDTVASADGELRAPSTSASPTLIGTRSATVKPNFPLDGGKVSCATCHDPHRNSQKFLRKNRLQQSHTPAQTQWNNWAFDDTKDQICLGCHTRLGMAWQLSAHADTTAANETYLAGPDAMRDFPTGTTVWQAGCLNCHDTHTVSGSRRLLREGQKGTLATVAAATFGYTNAAQLRPGAVVAAGTNLNTESAIENTCYQCHSDGVSGRPTTVVTGNTLTATDGVPNIAAEFAKAIRMPITNADQGLAATANTIEVHDITDVNGTEAPANLGAGVKANRHVECTDCHNPHRLLKANNYLGNAVTTVGFTKDMTRRTHTPANGTNGEYGNIAGGPLRGTWGVEPTYAVTGSSIWMSAGEEPSFTVKKGDPTSATTLPVGKAGTEATSYLTREYQLCFKCHSSYANGTLATDFADLKAAANGRGGTPTGTNSMVRYTNVAREFAVWATDPPTAGKHQGESTNVSTICAGGDCAPASATWDTSSGGNTINHRSWHPVVYPTGRNAAERGITTLNNIRAPFNTASKIGLQTMHCSDCHGSDGSWTQGTGPDLTTVQGPHGSAQNFLLKGVWSTSATLSNNGLCGNCHNPSGAGSGGSGFMTNHLPDGNMSGLACMSCHISVPHGWKNKAFLVNLGCVGTEGGETGNCVNAPSWAGSGSTRAPYYNRAYLQVTGWARSGAWGGGNCTGCGGAMKDCAK